MQTLFYLKQFLEYTSVKKIIINIVEIQFLTLYRVQ